VVSERIDTANQIRTDIKNVIEDNQIRNKKLNRAKRIKFSRISYDLNHFAKNC